MLRFLSFFALIFLFTACSGKTLYTSAIHLARNSADLTYHHIDVAGLGTIAYLDNERFNKPLLLLVHGFHGNKDNWDYVAKYLTSNYRLIAIDLPSQGDNRVIMERNFTLESQSQMLHALIKALQLKPFILAGHSMGGGIALNYALNYPERLKGLILIDAVGDFTHESELQKAVGQGLPNPLLNICTAKQYKALTSVSMARTPYIPDSVYRYLAKEECARKALYQKIFDDILLDAKMGERVKNIFLPTLIIWGRKDQVISYKDGLAFHEKIPRSNLFILNLSGHIPQIEEPEAVAQEIKRFLSTFGLH